MRIISSARIHHTQTTYFLPADRQDRHYEEEYHQRYLSDQFQISDFGSRNCNSTLIFLNQSPLNKIQVPLFPIHSTFLLTSDSRHGGQARPLTSEAPQASPLYTSYSPDE